jgi:hypothetical protein
MLERRSDRGEEENRDTLAHGYAGAVNTRFPRHLGLLYVVSWGTSVFHVFAVFSWFILASEKFISYVYVNVVVNVERD